MEPSWMYASNVGSGTNDQTKGQAGTAAHGNDSGNSTNYSALQAVLGGNSTSPGSSSGPYSPPRPSTASMSRIRRRNRQITSCLECRRRKLKCDKQAPCTNCTRFKRDCLYLAPALDQSSQQKLADLKDKMGALEKNLEREVVAKTQKTHLGGANVTASSPDEIMVKNEDEEDGDDPDPTEDNLEPTPLAALDQVYEENVDDELMDLGVQMGKMRISERIGGWIRPKLVDELNDTLEDVKVGKSRYSTTPNTRDHPELRPGGQKLQASPKSYIGPGPDYIAPASSFFFPGTNMNTNMIDYLPSKMASDRLVEQYWHAVHYMCRTVHRPTFEAQYTVFWGQIATGSEPVPSLQAIIFAVLFSAAVSMTDSGVLRSFGTTRNALIDSLRSGTEMALAKANFLRTTKLDTMQAFVMYLIPLIRAEVSRAHSALVGTAIRLAECMGLHRDGSLYSMTALEVHIRRMIWHQLCFLDMRTCEATGPRPQIRKEDYDTKMPLNVDDTDLLDPNHPPTEDKPGWTDMTLGRIRAEYQEMRRQVWYDIVAIDKKKKSLTSVLVKIQKLRKSMEERFLPIIDESVPFQALSRLIFEMGINGLHIQVLHRYLFSTSQRMPDRLRQVLIEAGIGHMECGVRYETEASMSPWSWYRGAFNQYHVALLLLVEVYAYPMRKEAPRIWKCLDYIFEIPTHLAPKQKAELVLTDLRDRMQVYNQVRKVKISNQMQERAINDKGFAAYIKTSPKQGIDHSSNTQLTAASTNLNMLHPTNFSPPPPADSTSSGSRQGSVAVGGGDMHPATMEDIDWAEWEKVFNPEVYTGDLNIPDFDMTDFTGDFNAPPLDPATFNIQAAANISNIGIAPSAPLNIPNAEDLSDVSFTPAFFPSPSYPKSSGMGSGTGSASGNTNFTYGA